jgi:hypothetical protein
MASENERTEIIELSISGLPKLLDFALVPSSFVRELYRKGHDWVKDRQEYTDALQGEAMRLAGYALLAYDMISQLGGK